MKKNVVKNTMYLTILNITKIILPFITLPYLTRVLDLETYGAVSFVKSYLVYIQLLIDFGFILSSVKDIVNSKDNKKKIGEITGETILAKLLLAILGLFITLICVLFIPILKDYILFTILSFINVAMSCFLLDFLFRGIEKMHIITIVFVIMKLLSTILTFFFVKSNDDINLIPIIDIVSSFVAIIITLFYLQKIQIKITVGSIKSCFKRIKKSFFYFLSNMATSVFGALTTLLIGIFIDDKSQISYWTVSMNVVSGVQAIYSAIVNGIYPYMVETKDLKYISKVMKIIMPIILIGAFIGFLFSKYVLLILGGEDYLIATPVLRSLIPLAIISFPSMLYGWPVLGSIDKVKETTFTTSISAIIQILLLILLILFSKFTLINIALSRLISELVLLLSRIFITYKNKNSFKLGEEYARN